MLALLASIVIVTNIGFTVGYDTDKHNPCWVAYDLEPNEVVKAERRSIGFVADPRIEGSDMTEDYKAASHRWDRGHLAPAADFNWSTNALRQTYYFSNVCPMTQKLNRGEWRKTEDEVRRLAESGTVHVVIFPKYEGWYAPVGRMRFPTSFVKVAYGWFGVRMWNLENKDW